MNIKTNRNADDQPKLSNWNVYYWPLPSTEYHFNNQEE